MTPQELKSSILQLAVQGKLVEQQSEEGTAEELFLQIQEEKQRLIKEGKIKKEKPLPEITEDEIPFDIPESWKWVKLGDFCLTIFSGKSPKYSQIPNEYLIIGQAANKETGLDMSQIKYSTKPFWDSMDESYFLKEGDVLLNTLGNGTLGRSGIVKNITEKILTDGHLFIFRTIHIETNAFLYHYLQYMRPVIEKSANGSTNQTFLSLRKTSNWVIPLPPLAEQKRIVAKIEELLPYVDRYEKAWSKLEDFNKRFPADMQKSVLQMAIQGKLVEQRPEEGTAEELYTQIQTEKQRLIKEGKIKKQKPLPKITDDVIPFDIPCSWKWVRLGSLLHKLVDGTHRTPKYTTSGVPFVSVRNMSSGKLSLENTKFISEQEHKELCARCNPERGDLLLSKVGTTGVPAKIETDAAFSLFVSVALLKFNNELLDIDFLVYSILAPDFQKQCTEHTRGVGNKNWVIKDIANTIMPLPPLAEQKRIVQKLDEIIPLCEKLK